MRVSGELAPPTTTMPPHRSLLFGAARNRIGALAVPSANIRPPFVITRSAFAPNSIVVPGSIVSVTPSATVTLPVRTKGLPEADQVVLAATSPLRSLAASGDAPRAANTSQARKFRARFISSLYAQIKQPFRQ